MKVEYALAEELVNVSIKNFDPEKKELVLEALNKALILYNEYILTEVDIAITPYLYFQRSKIFKHLGVVYHPNYYLDVKFAAKLGHEEAIKIFNDKKFKEDNSDEKITFVFEITEHNNEVELSSLFMKGHEHWIDKIVITTKLPNETASLTNFNISFDNMNYTKIRRRLAFGTLFSDDFVCNNLIETRAIVNKIMPHQLINDKLKLIKGLSLIDEIEKFKIYKTDSKNNIDSFNTLFNTNLKDCNNSEINVNLTAECYGFFKYVNRYPSISKNDRFVNNILKSNV